MDKETKNEKDKENINQKMFITREEFDALVKRVERLEKKLGITSGK